MATVTKDFKIKYGLIVEGSNATVNGYSILTKSSADQNYIIGLIGGSATPLATPDTVVLRDGNADFAAGTITADLIGNVTGTVSSLSNHTTDALGEGTTNKYYTDARVKDVLTNSTKTNISITNVAGELHITAENGVADSTTDDLAQGTTNKYYSDALVDSHLSGGDGITYSSGTISADVAGGLKIIDGQVNIDRAVVDGWYDANGAATGVQSNLDDHASDTTTHGVTGDIVGTSDSQVLTNKTINDELEFTNPSTQAVDGGIMINDSNENFEIRAYTADIEIVTNSGDITLNPSGTAYYGGTTAADEIATHGYVDNAVAGLNWKQAVNLLYDAPIPALSGSGASQLILDGHDPLGDADSGYRILITQSSDAGIYVFNSTGGNWTLTRAADADTFEELVGAAVYVMEGNQYGSTSWVQGDHYLTNFSGQDWTQFSGQGSVTAGNGIDVNGLTVSIDTDVVATQIDLSTGLGTKQNTLTAGTNIDISNDTVSVTGLASTDIYDFSTAALSANQGYWDTVGAAAQAEQNANQFTTSELASYTTTANLNSTIDGLGFAYTSEIPTTTDELTEGTYNHYYTDQRAETAAGNMLANATKSNIEITYNAGTLTINAENGIEDSTTDDLDEGSTHLYFTDQRAQDAVDGTTRSFTSININTYRTEEATQQYIATASTVTAHTFTGNKSVKYIVRTVGDVSGTLHSQVTELLATVDAGNNVAVTEYGTIYTSENALSTATVDYAGGEYRLRITTAVAGAEVIAAATIMSWAD